MSTYEISQSSLLSLKAEILRKKEELGKVKHENKEKLQNIKKNAPLFKKNKGVEDRIQADYSPEDENLLKKSREMLEAKSKLYDQLSKDSKSIPENEQMEIKRRFLVCFDKKLQGNDNEEYMESSSESDGDPNCNEYATQNPEEEWVEYVDSLGRTRTCLKKDLEHIKQDDDKLREEVERRKLQGGFSIDSKATNSDNDDQEPTEGNGLSKNELESDDMRRELLREKWEKEEEELRNKSKIHYQDVLFDEARSHGVGYYGFSKDEEQRAQQQEALKKLREETEEQQRKSQEMRALREKQLAARLKAAKNRKRARLGLPPEEDEPEPEPQPAEENKEQKEPEIDEKEAERERKRKNHIRPWDLGKEGVSEHYVMSQDEWNEEKRKERPEEFAPPSFYRKNFRSHINEETAFEDCRKFEGFATRQTTNKKVNQRNQEKLASSYDDWSHNSQPVPIINECEEGYDRLLADYHAGTTKTAMYTSVFEDRRGAEVPPPAMMEYPGTSTRQRTDGKEKQNKEFDILYDYNSPDNFRQMKPVPIINECEDADEDYDRLLADYHPGTKKTTMYTPGFEDRRGAEVPPPIMMDYRGTSTRQRTDERERQNKEFVVPYDYNSPDNFRQMKSEPRISESEEVKDFDNLLADYYGGARKGSENTSEMGYRRTGAEIPPPVTMEYCGPANIKRARVTTSNISLEDSISAGLQFLRKEFEKKEKTKHRRDDEMFLC